MPDGKRPPVSEPLVEAALDVWRQAGERHFIRITGHSMLPLLRDGDQVLVAHGYAGVRRGDVVVLRHNSALVAHRVLRIFSDEAGTQLLTKGDNASQFDPVVSAEAILGRVLAVKRDDRQMSLDSAAWQAWGWLMAVSALAWTRLSGWGQYLKRSLLGPEPNRLTALLRRGGLGLRALVLKVALAVLCRWKA